MAKYYIANEAIKFIKEEIKTYFGREMGSIQHRNGGVFVSAIENGKMMSAYWHPEKTHSATCLHHSKVVQRAVSDPGYWAIAYAKCSLFGGNKTMFNDDA